MPEVVKKPYIVACEPEIAALENSVSRYIQEGYVPSGSLVIQTERNEQYYYQAMILRQIAPAKA